MISEDALLKLVNRFDEQALAEVYDRYSPELYRYAARLLGDKDLAEDCVAETFSRFLFAIKHGNGPRQYLRAYLYRVAHNWVTDHFRRRQVPTVPLEPEWHAGPETDPDHDLAGRMDTWELRQALWRLTPEQRQVILLKYIEDWDNQEIAQALDKPVGAIKALQHRALNTLRRFLSTEEVTRI